MMQTPDITDLCTICWHTRAYHDAHPEIRHSGNYGVPVVPPAPRIRMLGRFETTAREIGNLVEKKNAAYGSSFEKCGDFLKLLYPQGMKPEQYQDALMLVRIFDKQMRIATDKDALGENPYRDIAGYGILGAAVEK